MLDSFDSTNPDDYIAGFPFHPHRGIETITYLASGRMDHRDSLGNEGTIRDGQAQWMCAGLGIMHEEMPQPMPRMLGIQLWLNLPAAEKMSKPAYHGIDAVEETVIGDATIRVVAGSLAGVEGFAGDHLPAEFYDIQLPTGASVNIPVKSGHAAHVFLLEGDLLLGEKRHAEKSAVAFADDGDTVTLTAPAESPARVIYFSALRIEEPVAWGGPIVMNTDEELQVAFDELRDNTFIKEQPEL